MKKVGLGVALLLAVAIGGTVCAKTKLVVSSWSALDRLKEAVAVYEKENPDVSVTIRKGTGGAYDQELLTWAAGGKFPDALLMYDDGFATFANAGMLLDVTRLVSTAEKATFYKSALETCVYKGKLYGLPHEWVVPMMFYNKQILAKAGIGAIADAWTWVDFLSMCKKTTLRGANGKVTQIGYSTPWGFFDDHCIPTWILANGGRLFNDAGDKCLASSDKSVKAIEWWRDLVNMHQVAKSSSDFESGNAAFNLMMRWGLYRMAVPQSKIEDQLALAPVPYPTSGADDSRIKLATKFWCVSRSSKHKAEAKKLVSFLSSVKGQSIFAVDGPQGIPGVIGVKTLWPEYDKQFISQEHRGIQLMPEVTQFRKVMDILSEAVNVIVTKNQDARTKLTDATNRVNVILRRK